MLSLAAAHLAITAAYCGVLWVVQVVVYPQFQRVPASAFKDYHRAHCTRMGWVVAPLFVAEGVTALALAWVLWAAQPVLQGASIGLFVLGHGITFAVFVPLHQQLERGPVTRGDLRRAVRLNWLRMAAATARVAVVFCAVGGTWEIAANSIDQSSSIVKMASCLSMEMRHLPGFS